MSEIRATFLCVGGFFTPVLPVDPELKDREIDQVHYFSIADVANSTGVPDAALHEAYSVFLQEVGNGIQASESTATARERLRSRFPHLNVVQFEEFLAICRERALDPFSQYVSAILDGDSIRVKVSPRGRLAIAIKSGELLKMTTPEWAGEDGKWVDFWGNATDPAAARMGVVRRGMEGPLYSIAYRRGDRETAAAMAARAQRHVIRCAFADLFDVRDPKNDRPKAPVLSPQAIDEKALSSGARWFHEQLIKFGFHDPGRRNRLIEHFREQYPLLYAKNTEGFYSKVIDEMKDQRNPMQPWINEYFNHTGESKAP